MDKNIFEIVEEVLKTREKYVSEDDKLLKAIVCHCYFPTNKLKKDFLRKLMVLLFSISKNLLGLLSQKNFCQILILGILIKLD